MGRRVLRAGSGLLGAPARPLLRRALHVLAIAGGALFGLWLLSGTAAADTTADPAPLSAAHESLNSLAVPANVVLSTTGLITPVVDTVNATVAPVTAPLDDTLDRSITNPLSQVTLSQVTAPLSRPLTGVLAELGDVQPAAEHHVLRPARPVARPVPAQVTVPVPTVDAGTATEGARAGSPTRPGPATGTTPLHPAPRPASVPVPWQGSPPGTSSSLGGGCFGAAGCAAVLPPGVGHGPALPVQDAHPDTTRAVRELADEPSTSPD